MPLSSNPSGDPSGDPSRGEATGLAPDAPAERDAPAEPGAPTQPLDALDPVDPIDPDAAPPPPDPAHAHRTQQARTLLVIALGGALGASARYGATLLWPYTPGAFPWTTFWVNVTGCAAMGLLMVVLTERLRPHPLVRPFLGTGILGGYTTFSTYALDARGLFDGGRPGTALLYLAATLAAAMAAVTGAAALTRLVLGPRPERAEGGA